MAVNPLAAQCPFYHSLWGSLSLGQPGQLQQATQVYPGEYIQVDLQKGACYRAVVIDTFERSLQLLVADTAATPMAMKQNKEGEALVFHWRPETDQIHYFGLSMADCEREWRPLLFLLEWTELGEGCPKETNQAGLEAQISDGK